MADSLTVRLALDSKNYVAGASKAAKATDQISGAAKGGVTQQAALSKSTLGSVASFAKLAVGTAAVAKGLQFAGDAIQSYSNLEESLNAVNVQFGEGADTILKFGETAAESVGLANSEFNQLSVTTGAIFATFIDDEQEAAEATIKLTQRAADLASVFNTDVDEALLAVQASLRGEQEPIRRFGVSMDDLAVKAKAVELGLADSTSEVSQQAKQMARLEIIYDQTAKVAGDFAATSDSLANSQKTLAASFEDAKAKVGESLAPVMEALIELADELVPALEAVGPAIEDVSKSLSDLIKGAADAAPAVAKIIQLLQKAGAFKPAAASLFESLGLRSFLPVTGALGFVWDAVNALKGETEETSERAEELRDMYVESGRVLVAYAESVDRVTTSLAEASAEERAAAFEVAASERAQRAAGVAAYEAAIEQGRFERSLKSKEAFAAWESEVSAAAEEAEANLRSSMGSIIDLFAKAPDKIKTSVAKMVDNIRGQREMAEAFEENMRLLGELGLDALVGELEEAGPAAVDQAAALVADLESAFTIDDELRRIMGENVNALESELIQSRLRELGMTAGEAWAAGFNLTALGTPSVTSPRGGGGGRPVALAAGGPLAAGQIALVGEKGPELFMPDTSGQVIPAGETGTAGSGGNTVQVFVEDSGGDVADKTALGLLMGGITEEIEWAGTSTIR